MLPKQDERLLEHRRVKLMASIDIVSSDLLAQLRSRFAITAMQEEDIRGETGTNNKVGRLLDILLRGDKNTVDKLIYALRASGGNNESAARDHLREPLKDDDWLPSDDEDSGHSLGPEFEKHMPVLLNAWPYRIHDCLLKGNLLSRKDFEAIKGEKTTHDQNLKLYDLLNKSGVDPAAVKAAVCDGLCQTSQYCPFAPADKQQQPVSESQHEEIRQLRDRLLEMDVNTDGQVLDHLIQAGIVDMRVRDMISSRMTRSDMMDTLLSFMSRTHSKAHAKFMQILRETNEWIFYE